MTMSLSHKLSLRRDRIVTFTLVALVALAASPAATPAVAEESGDHSLMKAAETAQNDGRTIATDLIGLGCAIAAIMLAFRRDFKEAAGVFAIGVVAILLSTGTGVDVLKSTVTTLFG